MTEKCVNMTKGQKMPMFWNKNQQYWNIKTDDIQHNIFEIICVYVYKFQNYFNDFKWNDVRPWKILLTFGRTHVRHTRSKFFFLISRITRFHSAPHLQKHSSLNYHQSADLNSFNINMFDEIKRRAAK